MSAEVCKTLEAAYHTITSDTTTDATNCTWTYNPSITYWGCSCGCSTDKTGRALGILRGLMAAKVVKVQSIEKFLKVLDIIQKNI